MVPLGYGSFSMLDTLRVFASICICMLGVGFLLRWAMSGSHVKKTSEEEVREWASSLNLQVEGVDCSTVMSDHDDGWVSCSVTIHGERDPRQLECRGPYVVGHGCRVPKLQVQPNPWR